jgi:hypothetical protein
MQWLDKLSRLIKISQKTKTTFQAFTSIVGVIIAIISTRNFMLGNNLTSIERIQQFLFVLDNRIELQAILKRIGKDTNADRVFFMFYEQKSDGNFNAVFKEYYQWQKEGQVQIFDAKYPIKKGADSDRLKSIQKSKCIQIFTDSYPDDDELVTALRNSNVNFQISCPVIDVLVGGKKRLGVIGLEFEQKLYNITIIERDLLIGAVDVAESFH